MAGAADLEVDAVLALEGDFAVVETARGVHEPESADERVRVETFELAGVWRSVLVGVVAMRGS